MDMKDEREQVLDKSQTIDFSQMLETAGVLVAVYDDEDRLRFANRAFRAA